MPEPTRLPVQLGDTIADTYVIDRYIGSGAMGVVFEAHHVRLEQPRAIKFMSPAFASDGRSLRRFMNEARAAARLSSEHAATIHDLGTLKNGIPYIVMEYLVGEDLQHVLDARAGQPMDIDVATLYVRQACSALREAHAVPMIHRDLKPANLFVATRTNRAPCVKVLDFGLAKLIEHSGIERSDLTQTRDVMGTPYYMSPDQMKATRDVDHRADIWSLGVILYELITGQRPFNGLSLPVIFAAVLEKSPRRPSELRPDVDPSLEKTLLDCLEKDPDKRLGSVQELMDRLEPFAAVDFPPTSSRVPENIHFARRRSELPPAARPSEPPPLPELDVTEVPLQTASIPHLMNR